MKRHFRHCCPLFKRQGQYPRHITALWRPWNYLWCCYIRALVPPLSPFSKVRGQCPRHEPPFPRPWARSTDYSKSLPVTRYVISAKKLQWINWSNRSFVYVRFYTKINFAACQNSALWLPLHPNVFVVRLVLITDVLENFSSWEPKLFTQENSSLSRFASPSVTCAFLVKWISIVAGA